MQLGYLGGRKKRQKLDSPALGRRWQGAVITSLVEIQGPYRARCYTCQKTMREVGEGGAG